MGAPLETDLGKLAEDYVSLALHLHNHDPNPYIFIGDKALEAQAKGDKRELPELERAFARLRLNIIEAIRSYVITYNYGLDRVTQQIEGTDVPDTALKWQRLRALFEQPVMPIRAHWNMMPRQP